MIRELREFKEMGERVSKIAGSATTLSSDQQDDKL